MDREMPDYVAQYLLERMIAHLPDDVLDVLVTLSPEQIEGLAREAVQVAAKTDFLNDRADALIDLAEILALAGRREEGLAEIEEAVKCYERKGNLPALERARRFAGDLDH